MRLIIAFALLGAALAGKAAQSCRSSSDCDRNFICERGYCQDPKEIVLDGDCNNPNEEWLDCGLTTEPTCEDQKTSHKDCSRRGCFCREGYVRDNSRKCIRKSDCPKKPSPSSDSCFIDRDCPSGFACGFGKCTPLKPRTPSSARAGDRCSIKADCGPGLTCRDSRCEREQMNSGRAGDSCRASIECESPLNCQLGKCSRGSAPAPLPSQHEGREGSRCITSFECESPLNCERGTCSRQTSAFTSFPQTSGRGGSAVGSMRQLFPNTIFTRQNGDRLHPEQVENSLTLLFFSNAASTAGITVFDQLKRFAEEIRAKGRRLEVIYLGIDDLTKERYDAFLNQFPKEWIALPYRDPLARELLPRFGVTGMPHITLYKGGKILIDDVREDLHLFHYRGDSAGIFAKWERL